jgi:hypothetical protein
MAANAPHVALLGDSIFDNGVYTSGAPDVVTHLRTLLPAGWGATLLARDGATIAGLDEQLRRLPGTVTHLVISVGGNDALQNADLLSLPVASSAQALLAFAERVERFEIAYRAALARVLTVQRRTVVCTVYNGALDADRARVARMGLTLFNDAILRTAIDHGLDAIELRSICTAPADYANPIEPSGQGGLKIARSIATVLGAMSHSAPPARIWGACG